MMYAAYMIQGDSVTLYRLYGAGEIVDVPDQIDGRTVEMLADHLFADEMSALCSKEELLLAKLEGVVWTKQEHDAYPGALKELEMMDQSDLLKKEEMENLPGFWKKMEKLATCGSRITAVHIPEGVRQIGNYAFYGLYELREVSFPSTMQRIGWGMFTGCRMTNRLIFHLPVSEDEENDQIRREKETTPYIMKEVLDSLSNEIDVIVKREGKELYRLHFPHYFEEGKENTPARIIEIIYHGTGHQYRNCFLNRMLQFDRYDEVFPLAAAQEDPVTNVHLILNRLRSGPVPKEEILHRYLEYLRQENRTLMEVILSDQEFDPALTLRMLDGRGYFTSTNIDASIQTASKCGMVTAVSCLMDIRNKRFSKNQTGKKRGRYEL